MRDYNDKILRGSVINGDQLKHPRAKAIYRAACIHDHVEVVQCVRNSALDEIITIKSTRLQIPEYPDYPIRTEEEVAIICRKQDDSWPEVYALREDFPLGLPHSNAKPYKRPVSMCVVDYSFYDVRLQFSAYDFICSIQNWFEKNSIGELHEANRPIEIFMAPDGVCVQKGELDFAKSYVQLKKITEFTATFNFADRADATHSYLTVLAEQSIATSMVYKPRTLGELADIIKLVNIHSLIPYVARECACMHTLINNYPLLLIVSTNQKRANGNDIRYGLFIVDINVTPRSIVQHALKSSPESHNEWLRSLPIKLYEYRDGISRELNRIVNGTPVSINHLTIIGTGTLGSNLIDHFIRKGVCERMMIVDNDYYLPHNYGRHMLPAGNIMEKKTIAMKKLYSDVENQHITPLFRDACKLTDNEQAQFYGDADLIVDASTIIAVERHLAKDISVKNGRCCSIFLNPQGRDLVLLMEDSNRKHRLDLLEMSYYSELLRNESLENHLNVPDQQSTSTFSCRSESNIMDYDDVGVLASIASREIQRHYQEQDAVAEIWRINKPEGDVLKVTVSIDEWNAYKIDDVTVYVSKSLQEAMNKERMEWKDLETGGCLCGCYDRDRRIIYVFAQIPAPEDSKHESAAFERGTKGLNEAKQLIAKRTYYQVRYLGEWHSHPQGEPYPGSLDKQQFEKLDNELLQRDVPFVQMICTPKGFYVNCRM